MCRNIAIPAATGLALVAQPLADLMVGEAMRDGAAATNPLPTKVDAAPSFHPEAIAHYRKTKTAALQRKC